MFKEGNLVRRVTSDGSGEIMRVQRDSESDGTTYVVFGGNDEERYEDTNDLELVTGNQAELTPKKPQVDMSEQTVAIVNFEGAVKREARAIREAIKVIETVSSFTFNIKVSGAIGDNDVNIEYEIGGSKYNDEVHGNTVKETLSEFLRRHGWDLANRPKAISYQEIPF